MNLHYQFWVSYYEDLWNSDHLTADTIAENNNKLTRQLWKQTFVDNEIPDASSLFFSVGYPGLLSGLGNLHSLGTAKDENNQKSDIAGTGKEGDAADIGLGFLFDPVTSLPYLPGSTVKGILRSGFMLDNGEYVKELLDELKLASVDVRELEAQIFGSRCAEHLKNGSPNNAAMGNDCFLDAFPVKPDKKGHLLGMENITPHRADTKELQGLTSPVPLNLLKIMPGVVMEFRFMLTDFVSKEGKTLTKEQKLKLFQQILLDFGAGAKTNVGFGMLETVSAEDVRKSSKTSRLVMKDDSVTPNDEEKQAPKLPKFSASFQKKVDFSLSPKHQKFSVTSPGKSTQKTSQQPSNPMTAVVKSVSVKGLTVELVDSHTQGIIEPTQLKEKPKNFKKKFPIGKTIRVRELPLQKDKKHRFTMQGVSQS